VRDVLGIPQKAFVFLNIGRYTITHRATKMPEPFNGL